MERETEGTVPPHLKWVWVEAVETALGSGASLQRGLPACQVCLWLLDLVCGTFSSLTSQPGACTLTLCHGGSYLERAQVRSRGRCYGFPWLLGPDGVVGRQSGPCLSLL